MVTPRPSRRQKRFQSILQQHGGVVTLRREKGRDIAAACGQLRLQTKQAEREVRLAVRRGLQYKGNKEKPPGHLCRRLLKSNLLISY